MKPTTKRQAKPAFVPKVGVECEYNHPILGWTGCTPIGLFHGNMICAPNGGGFYKGRDFEFRPIKSERELFIETAKSVWNGTYVSESILGELYDAGFRFVEAEK